MVPARALAEALGAKVISRCGEPKRLEREAGGGDIYRGPLVYFGESRYRLHPARLPWSNYRNDAIEEKGG
jgi:hypothetical protein